LTYLNQRSEAKITGVKIGGEKKKYQIPKHGKTSDKKLWTVFSEYIRRRDADEKGFAKCITCGLIRHWKKLDCGHGVPRQHWGTRYNEKNNNAQCKRCNGFEGGSQDEYAKQVDKKFGAGTWDSIVLMSKIRSKKLSYFEIDVLTDLYKKKIEEIKKYKGDQA
jgi:hypothetical protein